MNAPFKPDMLAPLIEEILADACVSISGLKKNPAAVVAEAQLRQVAILNRNRPVAYVISPQVWDYVLDMLDDIKLARLAQEEFDRGEEGESVTIEELLA